MADFDFSAAPGVSFIDHQTIDWREVRRTRSLFYQRFQYEYPGPIADLKQRLVVLPAPHYGTQHLRQHLVRSNPSPAEIHESADKFGNSVLELYLPEADKIVLFEAFMIVESEISPDDMPPLPTMDTNYWLTPTRLTTPDERILELARSLQSESKSPADLAQRISDQVYRIMRYQAGVTFVDTTASDALALGAGLCQDYSHIMLSICRAAGLPARYVSGHLLGDGGSHAWVEVLLPSPHGTIVTAFDPTNDRRPGIDYVTVAVGRDYRDVSPTSGSFTASYGGELTCGKRSGLIRVEYRNGDIQESAPLL